MIDRLIIYLWLFLSVVLIIAAAGKISCVRF
nr:MAG TPA: actin-like protein [Caudoviricetes sp.]